MIIIEKILSQEERIRRAEEIYARRRLEDGVRVPERLVNSKNKSDYKLLKKLILQIIISLTIYLIMYLIKTENYIFSESVLKKTREILQYDINVTEIYNGGKEKAIQAFNYINSIGLFKNKEEQTEGQLENNANIENTNKDEQEKSEETKENHNNNTVDGATEGVNNMNTESDASQEIVGIGGGSETSVAQVEQQTQAKTQMEIDAEFIKKNHSLIMPIVGTVTSRFGKREASGVVSSNHTGIDIGASKGTQIKSSIDGEVVLVNSDEYYGNYIKVQNGELNIIFAHCDKILKSQGAKVKQGEIIATVGVTGKTTGPHLHFEVKRADRLVNPEMLLTF